jgi:hypothetical protein
VRTLPEAAAIEKPSPEHEVDGRSVCDTERGKQTMADEIRREHGRAMRRKLMGEAVAAKVDKTLHNDPIMEKFAEVTQETIFGTL